MKKHVVVIIIFFIPVIVFSRIYKLEKRYIINDVAARRPLRSLLTVDVTLGKIINVQKKIFTGKTIWLRFYYPGKGYLYIPEEYTHPIPVRGAEILSLLKTNPDLVDLNPADTVPFYYRPRDLIRIPVYTVNNEKLYLREKAAIAFFKMCRDAEVEGVSILAYKAFTSPPFLAKTYFKNLEIYKKRNYLPYHIDIPTTSNLHTGFVVDITSPSSGYKKTTNFFFSKAYKWLIKNSHRYGFYPIGGSYDEFTFKPYRFRYYFNSKLAKIKKYHPKFKLVDLEGIAKLRVLQKGNLNITYFKIHDEETTAASSLRYMFNKYGGRFVELINSRNLNGRNLCIKVNGRKYYVDPNRIFTDEGMYKKVKQLNYNFDESDYPELKDKLVKIRNKILSVLKLSKNVPFIYVHTNKFYSVLSVWYLKRLNRKLGNAFKVYWNKDMHPKLFIYVIQKKDYEYFKRAGINVVLQIQGTNIDDGSLSVYTEKNIPEMSYATLETMNVDPKAHRYIADVTMQYYIRKYNLRR